MILANLAGIRVFATGGIGGVHRGASSTMDISADLTELSRTPVTVVSSGVKSILDIPKTLEVLETLGVPVCGYRTTEFPGFFTNVTGCDSPLVVDSPLEVARMMHHSALLGLTNGMLVAVPNPKPATEVGISDSDMAMMIEEAVAEAVRQGIEGAAITPFLLAKVAQLSGGSSVDSNVALVCNNAMIATLIAKEYALISGGGSSNTSFSTAFNLRENLARKSDKRVIVVGGMVIDHVVSPSMLEAGKPTPLILKTSNPGTAVQSFGGVGRNIAEAARAALTAMGPRTEQIAVQMVSAVGNDAYGASLLRHSASLGIDVSTVIGGSEPAHNASEQGDMGWRTATYTAVHAHDGDLLVAVADMDIFKKISREVLDASMDTVLEKEDVLAVADGNISPEAFQALSRACSRMNIPLFFEPTSVHKCTVPIMAECLGQVYIYTKF